MLLGRVILAAAIGLLLGIEQGWQQREEKESRALGGIRTFTVIGLLGGICGLISLEAGPIALGLAILGFSAGLALVEMQHMRLAGETSATDFVTALMTFGLGIYAVRGNMTVAAAAAVLGTVVLAERRILHGFLKHLTWLELRAGLLLLVMTVVLLPLLPDRPIDPWGALNPHQIWLMTVMIAAISSAGYISMRLGGERRGLLFAGMTGGLITSTTVTWTFARLVRTKPAMQAEVTAAILSAWIVSLLRMAAIAIAIAPAMAPGLLPPVLAAAGLLALPMIFAFVQDGRSSNGALPLENPFELSAVLKFGALLTAIMLLGKLAGLWFGGAGLSALSAASGLLDVDPITLTMAEAVKAGTAPQTGVAEILIAALANGVAKTVLAFFFGGRRIGLVLAGAMLAATAIGMTVFWA